MIPKNTAKQRNRRIIFIIVLSPTFLLFFAYTLEIQHLEIPLVAHFSMFLSIILRCRSGNCGTPVRTSFSFDSHLGFRFDSKCWGSCGLPQLTRIWCSIIRLRLTRKWRVEIRPTFATLAAGYPNLHGLQTAQLMVFSILIQMLECAHSLHQPTRD
jgi:hypothetical protein